MSTPDFAYADDPRAYRAELAAYEHAERIVRALIGAAGGPFVQRRPTRAQCCTELLDGLAKRSLAWLRSSEARGLLARHGLTLEQVERWREGASFPDHADRKVTVEDDGGETPPGLKGIGAL